MADVSSRPGTLEECAMADIAQLHRRALDETRSVVAGTDRAQWADATPCDGWDVQALLNHLVSGNLWAAELGSGRTIEEVGARLDGDVLGDDSLAAYDTSAEAAAATFEAPGALDAPCAVSYGPVPGSVYAGHRFIDVLIHGWDLATATGQDATLDPNWWTPPTGCSRIRPKWCEPVVCSARTFSCPPIGTADATPRVYRSQRLRNTAGDFAASAATAGRRSEVGFRGPSPLCRSAPLSRR